MNELRIFFTAIMFYTRIPVPGWVDHKPEYINQSLRYFPFIGWIGGVLAGLSFLLGDAIAGSYFGIVLSLIVTVLLTGAFHEDGFADVCDGFGGGWTKQKILEIMKDSRIGTYGVVGLLLLFSAKFLLLHELIGHHQPITWWMVILLFIAGHTTSRFMAGTFVFTHGYVRDEGSGMNKPVVRQSGYGNLFVAALFTLIPFIALLYFEGDYALWLLLPLMYIVKWWLGRYYAKWIGGYTGDCLGATQQVTEVFFYLFYLVILKFALY